MSEKQKGLYDHESQDLLSGIIPTSVEGRKFYNLQYAGLGTLIIALVSRWVFPVAFTPAVIASGAIIITYQILRFVYTPNKKIGHILWILGFACIACYFIMSFTLIASEPILLFVGASLGIASFVISIIQQKKRPKTGNDGTV